MTSFSNSHLKVQAKTWSRDSYGLYDYETSSLNFQNITVNKPSLLTRIQNEITCNNPLVTLTSEANEETLEAKRTNSILASVTECPEGIKISASKGDREAEQYEHAFWSVIERENTSGHMLQVNDVIRLGRVIFKINQIRVVDEEKKNPQHQKIILDSIKAHMQKDPFNGAEGLKEAPDARLSTANYCCKICLGEEEDPADPLITPCDCTGSVGYVHLKCIQNWMKLKLNMQQNKNIITIFWKNLYCELCKKKFPLNVVHRGEDLSLVPIDNKISGSYVVMESFSKEKDSTGIHLIDLSSNQDFKMGRGHDCDLKIQDISVSRVHALLAVSKGKLYLKDNLSKFGTLVLHKGDIIISNNNQETCWIQCGRTILKFSLKKPFFSFLCFGNFCSLNKVPAIGKLFGKEKEEETKRLTQEGDEIKQNNGLRD